MRAPTAFLIAISTLALAVGRTSAQIPPAMLPAYLASMSTQVDDLTDPILQHPLVPEADKEKVRAMAKAMRAAMAKAQEEGKGSPEAAMAAMQKMPDTTKDLIELLAERPDLKWVEERSAMCQTLKASLIGDPDGTFLSSIKLTAGEDKAKQAKAAVDGLLAEAMKANAAMTAHPENFDQGQAMELSIESSKRLAGTLKTIDALLTPEQLAAFEWIITHGPHVDEQLFDVIGYSTLPGMMKVPAGGDYVLKTVPLPKGGNFAGEAMRGARTGGPVPQAVEVGRVNLAKGDPIGFKKQGEKVVAVGGSKVIELTGEMVRWEYVVERK